VREKVLSVTIRDCDVEHFRCGGPGGQNQNKRDTGTRIRHRASGAVGESREHRTQLANTSAAWKRMAASSTFRVWIGRQLLTESPAETADKLMAPENLTIEIRESGKWTET
jgi:protein subunit release factor B